jgi:hypothetical protein
MCRRPSCCKPRSQVPGAAAVALIIGAGIVASKIRPEAHKIMHDVIDVLRTMAVTTAVIVAVTIVAWVTTQLVCWWLGHRQTQYGRGYSVDSQRSSAGNERSCLACGGKGEVLRANRAGRYEPRACPECQPIRLAG